MSAISMKALLETGVHFGHRTSKWHPKMRPYIFTERNGIHILDLQQTVRQIDVAYEIVRDNAAAGGNILFVGTKRQAQEAIQVEADRCKMPYVTERWLGGMLTNWRTMRERLKQLERLEKDRNAGVWDSYVKKERLILQREVEKLNQRLGGIRNMRNVPTLMFVVDVRREDNAVVEANKLNIPVIAMVDTNCNPTNIDFVIPANDDAIRAIRLIIARMADAVLEGVAMRKDLPEQPEEEAQETQTAVRTVYVEDTNSDDAEDVDLLGAATLAKISSGDFDNQE
ncbi:MAG TPA: 30S ribosomal protein S2 [Anaerolineales bacterium]|nr:30S ribosomal protein S2 [Anaerolineales bacterium]